MVLFPGGSALLADWWWFREIGYSIVYSRELTTRLGHTTQVHSVRFGPDNAHLVSSGIEGLVKVWLLDEAIAK